MWECVITSYSIHYTKLYEYLIRERREEPFARRFTLPQDIDSEKVEASFRNGVLSIKVPRKPESQPRQILIKSA